MRRAIGSRVERRARAALFVRGIKSRTRDMGPHERRSFDAVSAVREALLLLGHALRKGNCRVRFEPPAPRLEIDGSPVRFGQVVTNLVENAADASLPRGGGSSRSSSIRRDALVLRVRDAGTGIDPEILPRIFEPMFTDQALRSRHWPRARHRARRRDGGLRRHHRRRESARRRHHHHDPVSEVMERSYGAQYRLASSSGYTIVLADDDPDYLEATRLFLESEGHEVLCATNGDESLALLRERPAHLLLLDYSRRPG